MNETIMSIMAVVGAMVREENGDNCAAIGSSGFVLWQPRNSHIDSMCWANIDLIVVGGLGAIEPPNNMILMLRMVDNVIQYCHCNMVPDDDSLYTDVRVIDLSDGVIVDIGTRQNVVDNSLIKYHCKRADARYMIMWQYLSNKYQVNFTTDLVSDVSV